MTPSEQIEAAEAAALAGWTRARAQMYRREAMRQGYSDPVDIVATLYLARFARRGKRGPKAGDPIMAAIRRHSPVSDRRELARLRARIARVGHSTPLPSAQPRDCAAVAQQCVRDEAHRRHPGNTRWAREQRKRWRDRFTAGQAEMPI